MGWKIGHPLKRDGTSQRQRLPLMLQPEQVPIDARPPEELLAMLFRIAGQFSYYDVKNELDGDWQDFFPQAFTENGEPSVESIRHYLTTTRQKSNTGPFMAILLAFLHLYKHLQDDINRLSGEHLKYYYQQVLGFQRRAPRPDKAHVLFELSPQVEELLLRAGTQLKAGKDQLGLPLSYVTERDIVVNQTLIAELKTVLVQPQGRIYAAEVANSADGLGAALLDTPPSWPAFGCPDQMQISTTGFAIASQLLLLQEGERRITLTLSFATIPSNIDADEVFNRLVPYASGAEDWINLQREQPTVDGNQVVLIFVAAPDLPAIVPFDKKTLNDNLDTELPVLRLLLDPQYPPYTELRGLNLTQIAITVNVTADAEQGGLQQLIVQNDQSLLDVSSSFQPFGPTPAKGSQFYIGSAEAFSKPLNNFTVQIRWADLPDDDNGFNDYYNHSGYDDALQSNDSFTVDYEVLRENRWQDSVAGIKLFDSTSGSLEDQNSLVGRRIVLPLTAELPEIEQWDASLPQGFVRFKLNQDFGHRSYPTIFAKAAADRQAPAEDFPNPPYTPTIQSISLGYQASQHIDLDQQNHSAQLFHILPFGSEKLRAAGSLTLLPDLAQGNLYIGLVKFRPPQNIQLLFQVLEGSAESVDSVVSGDIQWHYLTANGWSELSGQEIFTDTTQGLQQPGIVAFNIGRDAYHQSNAFSDNLHWLRASIAKNPAGAARLMAIHPQAVTAVLDLQDNDPNHLKTPLASNRINALNSHVSAIKKISQPYESFNGESAEQDEPFFSRVSERLRHKQRAVNIWDYERLVLSEFPEVYKAKTIPHTGLDEDNRYTEFLPGHSSVVVIPQSRRRNSANPLEPKASVALLEKIRHYLLPQCSFFVGQLNQRLQVLNPRYEPIRLSFSVGFREGFDSGFYTDILNNALRRYLSPWAFDEGADIAFGGKVYKSQLLAFVEQQEYVDYITDFKLFHSESGPGISEMCVGIDFIVRSKDGDEVEVASASTAASILVSADRHQIQPLKLGEYPCDDPSICEGIGCWYIDVDFIIGETA